MAGLLDTYRKGVGGLYGVLEKISSAASPGMNPAADPQLEQLAGSPEATASARAQAQRAYNAQRAAALQKGARWWEMDALAAPAADDAYQGSLMKSAQAVDLLRKRRADTERQSALQKLIGTLGPEDAQLAAADPEAFTQAAVKKKFAPENENFAMTATGDGSVAVTDRRNGRTAFIRDPAAVRAIKDNVANVVQGEKELFVIDNQGQLINKIPYEKKTAATMGDLTPQQFSRMMTLSNNVTRETAPFAEQAGYYNQVKSLAANGTGMNDYAIVYAFNHMIEPESVVKEGERDFMLKVQSLRARMSSWIQNKKEGDILDPATRKEIVDTTEKLRTIASRSYERKVKKFKVQAKSGGFTDDMVGLDDGQNPFMGQQSDDDGGDGWSITVH